MVKGPGLEAGLTLRLQKSQSHLKVDSSDFSYMHPSLNTQ